MKITGINVGESGPLMHDGIALGADTPGGIVRDPNGVPLEWTLLRVGDNALVKNGEPGTLTLSAEDMNSILGYFESKGELIPIDSNHYLHELSSLKKLDEAEVLKLLPSGVAAMGYGSLALSGDELRFKAKWTPTAYELMKEKIFKYFSPAIRGFVKGPLRVTSVAMENEPAINHLDALAASANQPSDRSGLPGADATRKEHTMGKLGKALGRLLGRDSVALEAETKEEEKDKIALEVEKKANLLEKVRQLLSMAEDAGENEIAAALKAVVDKAASADTKQQQLSELAASAEKAEHARLVELGKSQGKITPAKMEWVNSLDSKALSAALPHMAADVPLGKLPTPVRKNDPADAVALTAEEKTICRLAHVKEEDYLKEKGGKA
ncbi:MAG: Mu-like prophage I protein [Lentisphaerae bacterium ADurb.Bin242]|nr:MAG: Mu-like prophage I protein [Lentisphaerae bacterium ADurb.Bin242]